ncbi:hypothetical protein PGT21_014573 [Puccinia graminis f. sp. tritici]|uniref:Uncharacterized protein n=1 Tax=Puccinia graminis f. sp. tritici TaxID=56615 RepID=A0A5B0M146_PUCGR|nr:hypothetical protein PGTUg99_004418 [Puccinia graminis f. sp. tritici]KAA1101265.1 hypothetical protein PGT21_014573 [Puccinia graminis f. sp. tritici]
MLILTLSVSGTPGPDDSFWIAIPEESDNKIMEISNIPEPISKRKKKAYKPSTEEPTVVHHSIKQCGNGHLVASSPPELGGKAPAHRGGKI